MAGGADDDGRQGDEEDVWTTKDAKGAKDTKGLGARDKGLAWQLGKQAAHLFGVGVLDGFVDGQGLGPELAGAIRLAELLVGQAQVAQPGSLIAPVADFLRDGQGLLVIVAGLARLSEQVVGVA